MVGPWVSPGVVGQWLVHGWRHPLLGVRLGDGGARGKEQASDFQGSLAAAFALTVGYKVASQSWS